MRNEARMRDGLATPIYWWVQAKIIGIDGGYNTSPSLPLVTERIHSPFQPKQSPSGENTGRIIYFTKLVYIICRAKLAGPLCGYCYGYLI